METETVEYLDSHRPTLESGQYTLTVQQKINAGTKIPETEFPKVKRKLYVAGERFSLSPDMISQVFPPEGSDGEYDDVLPHVILKRGTLPWERSPFESKTGGSSPWMALLILFADEFNSGEVKGPRVATLEELGVQLEVVDHETDKINLLEVKKDFWSEIKPTSAELPFLSHVRQRKVSNGKISEQALIMANRRPRRGVTSFAFLVSLEGRYTDEGIFDESTLIKDGYFQFPILKHWTFSCPDGAVYKITDASLKTMSEQGVAEETRRKLRSLRGLVFRNSEDFVYAMQSTGIDYDSLTETGKSRLLQDNLHLETFSGLLRALDHEPGELRLPPVESGTALAEGAFIQGRCGPATCPALGRQNRLLVSRTSSAHRSARSEAAARRNNISQRRSAFNLSGESGYAGRILRRRLGAGADHVLEG